MACMAGFSLSPPQGLPPYCWSHLQPSHSIKPSASISGRNFPKTKNRGLLICLITRSPAEYMGGIGEGAIKSLWKPSLLLQLIKYTSISAKLPLSIRLLSHPSQIETQESWEMAWVQITPCSWRNTPCRSYANALSHRVLSGKCNSKLPPLRLP